MKPLNLFGRLTLALATVALSVAACAPAATPTPTPTPTPIPTPTATPAAITVTDGLNRQVTLAAPAQRIVSLAPSNTEIVFALGAGAQLIGRDDFSDYPAEAALVPSIGSLYPSVNPEVIVALKPDLVLAAAITSPDDVQALADLGLTVYSTRFATNFEDVYADIRDLGALTGRADIAATLIADMQTRAQAVKDKVAGVTPPNVFYEIDATDPAKPWTTGPNTFIDQLITLAGGKNVAASATDAYLQLSLEELVAQNPQVIVLGSATYGGQTPDLVAARPGWQTLSAVTGQRVFTFDDNLVSRPGPRVVDGLEALARLFHPDLFK